jgi:type IV pilus assembly protein PilB
MTETEEIKTQEDRKRDPIGEFLVQQEVISEDEMLRALEEQKRTGVSLGKILVESGSVSQDDLTRAIAATHGIGFLSLTPDDVDPTAAHLVPERIVRQHRAIPVRIDGDKLLVATTSPLNLAARDEISLLTGYEVLLVATTEKELAQAIHHHFGVAEATKQQIVDIRRQQMTGGSAGRAALPGGELLQGTETGVIRLVDCILKGAVEAGASDIHWEPQDPEMRVRYRVDGILNEIMTIPKDVGPAVVARLKILADLDISEQRRPQDGRIAFRHGAAEYDLRVSALPLAGGEKIAIRMLSKDATLVELDRLGLSPEDQHALESLLTRPYGMVLITGPTGSGKTTTLYTVLRRLNSGANNIVTIEDPVEYRVLGINQLQVNPDLGMTFANGLRTILRQDPDIIMVGEIRDQETAELAVHAALTGHLVFSTLHTNDAAGALVRLADMGVKPFLIVSSVLGVVAQRLVRTICPDCKEPYEPTQAELAAFDPELLARGGKLSHGKGCPFCYQTGYRGRVGVFEVLQVTDRIRGLVTKEQSSSLIGAAAMEEGMKTLHAHALEKVLDGTTTLLEVERVLGSEGM